MKNTTTIEIDVAPLYREIGVDLNESVLAPGCLAALRTRLTRILTRQVLLEAMLEASKPPKRIRRSSPVKSLEVPS